MMLALLGSVRAASPGGGNGGGPPDIPPGQPVLNVEVELPDVEAEKGSMLEVPVNVLAEAGISMVTVSLEFDTTILDVVEVRASDTVLEILALNEILPPDLEWFSNDDEGWLQASLVLDYEAREAASLPPGRHTAMVIVFQLSPESPVGPSPLHFTRPEGARYKGNFQSSRGPVYNSARGHGKPFTDKDKFEESVDPGVQDGSVLVLEIIGDIGLFRRGDANADLSLDISDSLHILHYLFLGAEEPLPCEDAADSNDDGRIDISDPVVILEHLFMGRETALLSGPYPAEDHTLDELGCEAY